MKCFISSSLVCILCLSSVSQSVVYGIYTDNNAPYDNYTILATIEAVSGTILEKDTILGYEGVVLGSSSFDQLSANYIYLAAGNDGIDLLSRNVFQNTTVAAVQPELGANALQFDMATGYTYGLGYYVADSIPINEDLGWYEYIYGTSFISLDMLTGEGEVIGLLPQVNAVVLGASCFDPNNSIFYFIGISSDYETKLFGVNGITGELEIATAMNLGPNEYLNELEYDIQDDVFYAIHRNNTGTMHFARVNPITGGVTDLLDISDNVEYFTPDASVYQQDTDEFIMLTVSPNTLLTINADEAEIVSQASIDYNIIELEVDNIEFATSQFVSVQEFEALSQDLSPNPTSDYFVITGLEDCKGLYRILDVTGKAVRNGILEASQRISVNELREGIYLLELIDGNKLSTSKFVVQR